MRTSDDFAPRAFTLRLVQDEDERQVKPRSASATHNERPSKKRKITPEGQSDSDIEMLESVVGPSTPSRRTNANRNSTPNSMHKRRSTKQEDDSFDADSPKRSIFTAQDELGTCLSPTTTCMLETNLTQQETRSRSAPSVERKSRSRPSTRTSTIYASPQSRSSPMLPCGRTSCRAPRRERGQTSRPYIFLSLASAPIRAFLRHPRL